MSPVPLVGLPVRGDELRVCNLVGYILMYGIDELPSFRPFLELAELPNDEREVVGGAAEVGQRDDVLVSKATHDLRLVAGRVVGRPLTLRED